LATTSRLYNSPRVEVAFFIQDVLQADSFAGCGLYGKPSLKAQRGITPVTLSNVSLNPTPARTLATRFTSAHLGLFDVGSISALSYLNALPTQAYISPQSLAQRVLRGDNLRLWGGEDTSISASDTRSNLGAAAAELDAAYDNYVST
jgi:hypothetical protein